MYQIQVHPRIESIISFLHLIGLWNRGDKPTVKEMRTMSFYSVYYFLFPVLLLTQAFISENQDEIIFLIEATAVSFVMLVRLWYLIWNKKRILELMNQICVYTIDDNEENTLINRKLKRLMKFVTVFLAILNFAGFCVVFVLPFIGSERKLFFNVAFPLDWKNDELSYWIAVAFTSVEVVLCAVSLLCPVIIWYLLINCALNYEVLGHRIRCIGTTKPSKRNISVAEEHELFRRGLIAAVESHRNIKE